ncbi:MAG: flippase [Nanoarchaeota archaeon]
MDKKRKDVGTSLKLIARASLIIFIGVFISKILLYLYRIIIARYFGPEVYGLFSLALMMSGLFVAFTSFGIPEGVLRYIALFRGKNQNNKMIYVFNFAKKILFIPSLLSAAILFIFSDFIATSIFNNAELSLFLKISSLVIPAQIFSSVFLSTLRALERIEWYSFILNVFQNIIKVLSLFLLILIGLKSNAVILSYFFGILSMLLLSFYLSEYYMSKLQKKSQLNKKLRKSISREIISYSWPLLFLSIITTLFIWTDTFIIGYFLDAREVGIYNAAVPIALLMLVIPDLFMKLFFPLITVEYSRKKFDNIKELSKQVGKWIFLLNIPLFLIIIIFPGALINILFGQEYLGAENALRILAIGNFAASFMSTVPYNLISMIGKSKLTLINTIFFVILNLILNLFLVPKYGLNGAAIATTISYLALSAVYIIQTKYLVSFIPLRRRMIKIALVSLVSTALLIYVKKFFIINLFNLIILGIFFLLSYIALILLTGCLDKNDMLVLRAIKNKLNYNITAEKKRFNRLFEQE